MNSHTNKFHETGFILPWGAFGVVLDVQTEHWLGKTLRLLETKDFSRVNTKHETLCGTVTLNNTKVSWISDSTLIESTYQ